MSVFFEGLHEHLQESARHHRRLILRAQSSDPRLTHILVESGDKCLIRSSCAKVVVGTSKVDLNLCMHLSYQLFNHLFIIAWSSWRGLRNLSRNSLLDPSDVADRLFRFVQGGF